MAFSTFTTATTIASGVMNANFTDAQNQLNEKLNPKMLDNISLTSSVAANALTIAVKDRNGSDPSSTSPVKASMRSSTLTSGTWNTRSLTSALSLVVSSGSTLGQTSAKPWTLWIYLIDNAGTLELAISGSLYNENQLISTTAEGGAGASDSVSTIYSTTARSNVPMRLIGKLVNTQTTAGTWASAGTQLEVGNYGTLVSVSTPTVQTFTSGSGTYYTPSGVSYIRIRMAGGGGGGSGSSTTAANNGTSGGNGNNSTFGSSLLTASAGAAGVYGGVGGDGGAATVSAPAIGFGIKGGSGQGPGAYSQTYQGGGSGGSSGLGGSGGGGAPGNAGKTGSTNSGGGGGSAGGTNVSASVSGGGGGAGGYLEASITSPSSSYSYAVGSGGSAGGAGTSGLAGGAGAAGIIIVEEYYN